MNDPAIHPPPKVFQHRLSNGSSQTRGKAKISILPTAFSNPVALDDAT